MFPPQRTGTPEAFAISLPTVGEWKRKEGEGLESDLTNQIASPRPFPHLSYSPCKVPQETLP